MNIRFVLSVAFFRSALLDFRFFLTDRSLHRWELRSWLHRWLHRRLKQREQLRRPLLAVQAVQRR